MSSELRRIQRLRNLRSHREKAAERDLAKARGELVSAERDLDDCRARFGAAADETAMTRETTVPDFEMARMHVAALSRRIDRAERHVGAALETFQERNVELVHAHREVDQMDSWADITREAMRADAVRIDRVESDETAARIRSKT